MSKGGRKRTPYAVNCFVDGLVYLTQKEYDWQMDQPDDKWKCPICGRVAEWNDANYETQRRKTAT